MLQYVTVLQQQNPVLSFTQEPKTTNETLLMESEAECPYQLVEAINTQNPFTFVSASEWENTIPLHTQAHLPIDSEIRPGMGSSLSTQVRVVLTFI